MAGTELLELPARESVRRVALALLAEAAADKPRLHDRKDREALHDFRVALRRLRSALREYRSELDDSVRRGDRRRLRRLARATATSRDLEVHLEWLASLRGTLGRGNAYGLQVLRARLRAHKRKSDAALRHAIEARFTAVHHRLEARLSWYTRTVYLDQPQDEAPFAQVAAERLERGVRTLALCLSRVRAMTDQTEAHEARIAGKRLRYALEPIADAIEGGAALLERLKSLQDTLGDLHDAHVFADDVAAALAEVGIEESRRLSAQVVEGRMDAALLKREQRRNARPGLLAVATKLTERAEQAYAAVEREWLGSRADDFVAAMLAAVDALATRAPREVEIERKFLLRGLPDDVRAHPVAEIEQGYLPGHRLVERLRREGREGKARYFRTVKVGRGVRRVELEEEAAQSVFDAMWPLTKGRRVTKRRYLVPDDRGLTWEIDEFLDRELVLAEVELPTADTRAEPPAWLREYVVRDVTAEPEFLNVRLAR